MLKKSLYFFFLLFICLKNQAQFLDKKIYLVDSLEKTATNKADFILVEEALKLYKTAKTDTFKLALLSDIVENCNDEKIWTRYNLLLFKIADSLSKNEQTVFLKNKLLSRKAEAINNFGYYVQNYTNQPQKAINYFKEAAKLQEEIDDKKGLVVTNNNLANLLYNSGKVLEAINIYNKTIIIQEELKNKTGLTPLLNNLAEVYMFIGDSAKAFLYLKSALATALQNGDKRMIAQELQNVGALSMRRGLNKYAMDCLKRSLRIREEIGDKEGICKSKINLSAFELRNHNYAISLKLLNEVWPLVQQTDNLYVKYFYEFNMANYYETMKDQEKSFIYLKSALKYAQALNSPSDELQIMKDLVMQYKRKNDLKNEALAYRRISEITVKLNSNELRRQATQKQFQEEFSKKENDIKIEQAVKDEKAKDEKRKQKFITLGISFILLLTLIFAFFIFKAFRSSKQKNLIISNQKQEVEKQKDLIEEKQKEIVDSINYAKRIQNALLANEEVVTKNLPEHFILFKPKDIVSGDFYWANAVTSEDADLFFLAVCDSTGHGVPGAFMSLLNTNFLNEAINEKHIYEPDKVFNYVRNRLINSISKEDQKDGFDGILVCIDKSKNKITYAAANNAPILVAENKEWARLPFDKMPVGKGEKAVEFNLYAIEYQPGDTLYLYTDGFADQFGGPLANSKEGFISGKKFKYKPLNDLLVLINNVPLHQQSEILNQRFMEWKGNLEQVDDVCVVGFKL